MTAEEMAAKILRYIEENGDASFANLMGLLGEDAQGDLVWEMGPPNVVLWANMSQTLCDALRLLRPQILPVPCHILVYWADGMSLRLPLVKQVRAKGYRKEHWLPVVFRKRMPGEEPRAS